MEDTDKNRDFYCIVDLAKPGKPRLVKAFDLSELPKNQVATKLYGEPTEMIAELQNLMPIIAKDSLGASWYTEYWAIGFSMPCSLKEFEKFATSDYDFLTAVINSAERKVFPKDNLQAALNWDYKKLDKPYEYV